MDLSRNPNLFLESNAFLNLHAQLHIDNTLIDPYFNMKKLQPDLALVILHVRLDLFSNPNLFLESNAFLNLHAHMSSLKIITMCLTGNFQAHNNTCTRYYLLCKIVNYHSYLKFVRLGKLINLQSQLKLISKIGPYVVLGNFGLK